MAVAAPSGAPSSCLSAARIAPPAWDGITLDQATAARIGATFVAESTSCLTDPAGSAPVECRQAAALLNEYGKGRDANDLDAEYLRLWRACLA